MDKNTTTVTDLVDQRVELEQSPAGSNNTRAPTIRELTTEISANITRQNTEMGPPNDGDMENVPDDLRHYSFTDWNDKIHMKKGVRYILYGLEIGPKSGKQHKQGHIVFNSCKTLSAARKNFPGVDMRKIWKNVESSVTYCMKDGEIYEEGIRPPQIDKIIKRNLAGTKKNEWRLVYEYKKKSPNISKVMEWNDIQKMIGFWKRMYKRGAPRTFTNLTIMKNGEIYQYFDEDMQEI